MSLSCRRTLSAGVWLLSLVIFLQAVQELIGNIEKFEYWGRVWKVGLPFFIIIGVIGLFAAAVFLTTDEWEFGKRTEASIKKIRERLGNYALLINGIVILFTFIVLHENPWPWIFRWPHTQQFVILFAIFLSIVISYPWVQRGVISFCGWIGQFKLKSESIFLLFSTCFGLLYFFLIPPLMAPDESSHLDRSWAVSEFVLFQDQASIPANVYNLLPVFLPLRFDITHKVDLNIINSLVRQPLNVDDRVDIRFREANVYPAFVYFPQAIGIRLGRLFNLSPLLIYYSGRLVNFLVWVLLSWAALRITPVFKWAFMLLLFLPMSFYQALSISPDAITNALAFLFSAIVLRCASSETRKIDRKILTILFGISILLSLTKIPYFLLTLLIFIIPWQKFGTKRNYIYTISLLFITIGLFVFLANFAAFFSFLSIEQVRKIPPYRQRLAETFSDPLGTAVIVVKTIQAKFEFYFQSFLGVLGWLDTGLPQIIYSVSICALVITAITDGSTQLSLNLKNRAWIALISFGTFLAILLLIYFSFTPTDSQLIEGFQGRYLIPISPILILIFHNQKLGDLSQYVCWASVVYLIWLFIYVAQIIAVRFYVF